MTTISIYYSNKLEILLDNLIHSIYPNAVADGLDPFTAELVLVPQGERGGMGRWITHNVAVRTGICAQLKFITPAAFFHNLLGNISERSVRNQDALVWRIMDKLSTLRMEPAFSTIDRYLGDKTNDERQFALAQRIASVFEGYLAAHIDTVVDWEQGKGDDWQALLWRSLFTNKETELHWGPVLDNWSLYEPALLKAKLSARLNLFGIQALPKVYMRVLTQLAPHMQVQIFYLNPAKLVTNYALRITNCKLATPKERLDLANPLLATWGHKNQFFLQQLLDLPANHIKNFAPPGQNTLLQQLQNDILELQDQRGKNVPDYLNLDQHDLSVQIHACHSPLREIQVLHDQLLRLFATIPGLTAKDVVVMAPNMDIYAPYVEAVLGVAEGNRRIPCAIGHRPVGTDNQSVLMALRLLLQLPDSRLEASKILSLLQVAAVQKRFALDAGSVERIYTWVTEAGIRWGADAAQRAELQLPADPTNTWEFGLQRLFLGMALAPDAMAAPCFGIAPYPDIEGGEVEYLGLLQAFIERINYWREYLPIPRTLEEWRTVISSLCSDFFVLDGDAWHLLQSIFTELGNVATQSTNANFSATVSLALFNSLITDLLDHADAGPQRLLTGRVTFCALQSMSGIPFRVICLLGMNGVDFPPRATSLSFDLLHQTPQLGNPSVREDSKALFLDALLAARDCFYISYQGFDVRNNDEKTPSVMVSDLLDYIEGCLGTKSKLLVKHPLHPFSQRNFDGVEPYLHSYAKEWLEAARSQVQMESPRFITAPLEAPNNERRVLDYDELITFLTKPAAYFLKQRLGLKLPYQDDLVQDVEPFQLVSLKKYHLKEVLLPLVQAGWEESRILAQVRALGILPHGNAGIVQLQKVLIDVQDFVTKIAPYAIAPVVDPIQVGCIPKK